VINLDTHGAQACVTPRTSRRVGYAKLFMLADNRDRGQLVVGGAGLVTATPPDVMTRSQTDLTPRSTPQIVQRVVTTVVKAARALSDEQQRGELVLALWARQRCTRIVTGAKLIGHRCGLRLSPLLDHTFSSPDYKDAANEAFSPTLTAASPRSITWFDRRFLNDGAEGAQARRLLARNDAEARSWAASRGRG